MHLTLLLSMALLQNSAPASDAEYVQFDMEDGSVLMGKIVLERLTVKTRYGELVVPVGDVTRLCPGLGSKPELRNRVKTLVEELGDTRPETRDASEKKLMAMGLRIRDEVRLYRQEMDPEQRARIAKILVAFEELENDAVDEEGDGAHVLATDDDLTTPSFTMRGEILPKKFSVKTRYGEVTLELEHVRTLQRQNVRSAERKVVISAANFVALEPKDSGFTVEKGDRIVVRAEGTLSMTPWGAGVTSTPDGCAQCGGSDQGPQILTGALMMRIGKAGKWVKVGSRASLRASQSGSLQFGIAMNSQYVKA